MTYLANEGVLIRGGACDVAIDALLRDSLGDYQRHAPAVQESLETGRTPFERVRLALATHFHLDHWDAGAIARFLTNNRSALFASPPQAGAMLPTSLKPRVRVLWPGAGQGAVRLGEAGVALDGIPLDHGMPVEHLAYRLECGGRTLVHLGDAMASPTNFARLAALGSADVALVPFWWLADEAGLAFLRETWQPRDVVAFHFGAQDVTRASALQARLPRAWLCTEPGESRTY
ncbi:MAG TPA: MBL fold metallo-hydrolase [Vicinamibacteria bacterium]|nr:MBL fold metallo-hydrolase [Vicinamibacteria bacterium]